MTDMMTLSPSEYTGETGTCVCGRVVLSRGPFQITNRAKPDDNSASRSKGKGKGSKYKRGETLYENEKSEVHLLGGDTHDELLYIEGWAAAARELSVMLPRGGVFRIAGARKINAPARFSTSRLPYYLRFQASITKVTECSETPWSSLPMHHPFVDFENLKRVDDSLRVSLIGIVSQQPGLVERHTKYGPNRVCNAMVKQGTHVIRCGFWREHGEKLAQYEVGAAIVLHQVGVYFKNGGWEVMSSEGTVIEPCSDDLKERLDGTTNLNESHIALSRGYP